MDFDQEGARAEGADPMSPVTIPETLAQSVEHYVDHTHDNEPSQKEADESDLSNWRDAHPDASKTDEASERLTMNYHGADVPASADTGLGDLSTFDGREKALEQLTQQRGDRDPIGNVDCGAASMVGGALLTEGTTGLTKLADDIEAKRLSGDGNWIDKAKDTWDLEVLKAKIANNDELNNGDVQSMDAALYRTIKLDEQGVKEEDMDKAVQSGDPKAGLRLRDMQKFMDENPDLSEMYKRDHMDIGLINADAQRDAKGLEVPNHYVLEIKDSQKSTGLAGVYDPYHRRDGQVINDQNTLDDYLYSRVTDVEPGK